MEPDYVLPKPLAILGAISFLFLVGKAIHDIISYRRDIRLINKKFESREKLEKEFCWQHYKGGVYRIIAKGSLESDGTWMVVYQAKSDGKVYIRPESEWHEKFKRV